LQAPVGVGCSFPGIDTDTDRSASSPCPDAVSELDDMKRPTRFAASHLAVLLGVTLFALAACSKAPPQALGTLEFDRITLPAPAAERIVAVDVREGEAVAQGQSLLKLDPARTKADLAAAEAQVQRARDALAELKAGPRSEDIAQARATLAAAQADAREARAYYARLLPLKGRNYVAAADLDRARAAAGSADGRVGAASAALDELLHGTRVEQVAQGEAALASAVAQADAQRVLLDKLAIVAPRDARVDSLPYRLGDQAPVGAPLAILLAGDAPYARIYVPVQQRVNVRVGDAIEVRVVGRDQPYAGKVRMIRSEPTFTPYYALIGDDAARLSYLAEVTLGADAASLPVGLPVRVVFAGAGN
jgi:HlyD family secretion protein